MEKIRKNKILTFALLVSSALLALPLAAGKYDNEINKLQKTIERYPQDLDSAYQLGNYLAWEDRYDEALAIYQAILKKEPGYIDAEVATARVYAWKGEQQKAQELYQAIVEKEPTNDEAWQGLGSLALWNNDFAKSIMHFKKALKLNPKDIVSLKGIGRAYFGIGDQRRAQEYFTQAQILEIRKTPIGSIAILALAAGLCCIFCILVIRRKRRQIKEQILRLELQVLRTALALYQQNTNKWPLSLENLVHEKRRHALSGQEEPYVSGIRAIERGFLADPFKNRYWYNADTGGVYSATKGYEKW